jgi:polar amino acid transport system substrate-binding protein
MVLALRHLTLLAMLFVGCTTNAIVKPLAQPPSAEKPSLRLLSSAYPPFVDVVDKPRFAVELVSNALSRAGYFPLSEIGSLEEVLDALRQGNYDGSAALWRSPEREQFLLYSDAYLENRLMLVAAKATDVSATKFADIKGKKVGIVEGYAYGPELDDAKEPVFVRGASTEDNLRALLRGELDYVLCDALVIHHLGEQYPDQVREKLALGRAALLKRALHFTVRKDLKNAQAIIDDFNRELKRMLTDGTYHQLLGVQWIEADIDGDGVAEMVAANEAVGREPPGRSYAIVSLTSPGTDEPAPRARFVVKGIPYDTWQAVPEEYKKTENPLGNKPTTLRASVFEF